MQTMNRDEDIFNTAIRQAGVIWGNADKLAITNMIELSKRGSNVLQAQINKRENVREENQRRLSRFCTGLDVLDHGCMKVER